MKRGKLNNHYITNAFFVSNGMGLLVWIFKFFDQIWPNVGHLVQTFLIPNPKIAKELQFANEFFYETKYKSF